MFESAELGHTIDKATYEKEAAKLRELLLGAQFELSQSKQFPVIVVSAGVGGGGRSETANLLNEWMDPRFIETRAFGARNDLERERPAAWRYWQALPPKGRIGVLLGAWYHELLLERFNGRLDDGDLSRALTQIRRFETMLANEGALLVKLWFHLSRDAQRRRIAELRKDPKTRWRVSKNDAETAKNYTRFLDVVEFAVRETSTAEAPWMIVEATDPHYRDVTVGRILLESMRARLDAPAAVSSRANAAPVASLSDNVKLLRDLDMRKKIERKDFQKQLARLQGELLALTHRKKFGKRSVVLVFEGQDAAGKGSSIRRITAALDARQYRTVPIAAPTEEERAQPYLWRFWRHLPGFRQFTIFDRSWYGRVLVERVEKYCSDADWMRAYGEINEFEEQLARHGTIVVKFWLQISKDEQLRRFKARENTVFKQFKITPDDWRNRKKWAAYEGAVADMIDRTSTEYAPWTIVEAQDKYFGRIKVLRTVVDRLKEAL